MKIKNLVFGISVLSILAVGTVSMAANDIQNCDVGLKEHKRGKVGLGIRHGMKKDGDSRFHKLYDLVDEYAPELKDDYEEVLEKLKEKKEVKKEEIKEKLVERKEKVLDMIKEAKEQGLTREEMREKLKQIAKERKDSLLAKREEIKNNPEFKEKMEQRKEVLSKFREAVKNKDADYIKKVLEDKLEDLKERAE